MSTTAPASSPVPVIPAARPLLRPLIVPVEHGGWGFLAEPIVLALVVAPSWGGALLGLAALAGFLARQPLKYAMQDALRGRDYPRTRYCRALAIGFAVAAATLFGAAAAMSGYAVAIPFAAVAPLATIVLVYDARNRSRVLLPELAGAAAMSSTAAAIAIAGRMSGLAALALSGIVIARSLPSITYVRTLLKRAHGTAASSWPALALHAAAVAGTALFAPLTAVAAMLLLAARAVWGLTRAPLPARKIGWSEIALGAMFVALVAMGYR